jgi:predicted Zn-dependent protease
MSQNTFLAMAVPVTVLAGLLGSICSDSLTPAEALARSGERFGEIDTFRLLIDVRTDVDGLTFATEGEVAYQTDGVMYSRMSFSDETEILFLPPDLYLRASDGSWYVQSPWDQGIPRDELPEVGPDEQTIDYQGIVGAISDIEQLDDETIDGEDYLHYSGLIDIRDLPSRDPSDTDLLPFGVYTRTERIELWLDKETYLPRKLHVGGGPAEGESEPSVDDTFEFFEYERPITSPAPPENARPLRDLQLPAAACVGAQFAPCLEAQAELQPIAQGSCDGAAKRLCLVPLGQVSPSLVQHLVDHYRDQYGLAVTVLTPSAVPEDIADPLREQVGGSALIDYMSGLFPEAYHDPNAILIGLTPVDLYWEESHYRYVFGVRSLLPNRNAVISVFRMNPETYSEPSNDELLFSRSRKLFSKYVGLLYYELPTSSDPLSPMYDSILGPSDLDVMEEPLPVPSAR